MIESRKQRIASGIIFMSPALIIFSVIVIIPILVSAYYSLFDWNGISAKVFRQFDNYKRLLADPIVWKALKNSVYLTLGAFLIQLPIGMLLAVLLTQKIKGSNLLRTLYFLPVMLSTAVLGILWGQIYDPNFGLLNHLLTKLGLENWTHAWLGDPKTALFAVIAVVGWQYIGFYIVIYFTALQGISEEVLESAKIEGAGQWRIFFKIQLPLIWPTLTFTILNCVINSLKYFDLIYIMTGGGPNHASEVLASYMMTNAFRLMDYGYGSAISTFLLVFGMLLAFVVNRLLRIGNMKFGQ